jgi:hypothetical protein
VAARRRRMTPPFQEGDVRTRSRRDSTRWNRCSWQGASRRPRALLSDRPLERKTDGNDPRSNVSVRASPGAPALVVGAADVPYLTGRVAIMES